MCFLQIEYAFLMGLKKKKSGDACLWVVGQQFLTEAFPISATSAANSVKDPQQALYLTRILCIGIMKNTFSFINKYRTWFPLPYNIGKHGISRGN